MSILFLVHCDRARGIHQVMDYFEKMTVIMENNYWIVMMMMMMILRRQCVCFG